MCKGYIYSLLLAMGLCTGVCYTLEAKDMTSCMLICGKPQCAKSPETARECVRLCGGADPGKQAGAHKIWLDCGGVVPAKEEKGLDFPKLTTVVVKRVPAKASSAQKATLAKQAQGDAKTTVAQARAVIKVAGRRAKTRPTSEAVKRRHAQALGRIDAIIANIGAGVANAPEATEQHVDKMRNLEAAIAASSPQLREDKEAEATLRRSVESIGAALKNLGEAVKPKELVPVKAEEAIVFPERKVKVVKRKFVKGRISKPQKIKVVKAAQAEVKAIVTQMHEVFTVIEKRLELEPKVKKQVAETKKLLTSIGTSVATTPEAPKQQAERRGFLFRSAKEDVEVAIVGLRESLAGEDPEAARAMLESQRNLHVSLKNLEEAENAPVVEAPKPKQELLGEIRKGKKLKKTPIKPETPKKQPLTESQQKMLERVRQLEEEKKAPEFNPETDCVSPEKRKAAGLKRISGKIKEVWMTEPEVIKVFAFQWVPLGSSSITNIPIVGDRIYTTAKPGATFRIEVKGAKAVRATVYADMKSKPNRVLCIEK